MVTINLNDPLGTNERIRNATMPEPPTGPGAFQLTEGPQMTATPPVAPTLPQTAEPTIAQQGIQSGGQDLSSLVPGLTGLRDALGSFSAGQQQGADEDMVAGAAADASFYGPQFDTVDRPQDISVDEDAIRRQQLRLYQSEIDATNRAYDQLLNEARLEGQGRIGSQRAIAARGGILGSDFAGAQKDKVQSYNTDIRRGLEAERAAKIGAIMGDVRTSVANEIARKTAAKRADADTWIDYLKNEKQTRQNNINALAQSLMAQGVDVNDLSEEELAAFAQELGTTTDNIRSQYAVLQAQAQQDPESQFGFMSTSGGVFRTNPQTGEAEFIASPGASSSGGGSTPGETFTSGGLEISGGAVASKEQELNALRGQDGYTDSGAYTDALAQWQSSGGLQEDFFDRFPPEDYINPNDESLPKYIRDKAADSGGSSNWWESETPASNNTVEQFNDSGALTEEEDAWWKFW